MQSASTEIILFAGNFAPRDYQKCLGEQMILNSSLYYELGYTYSKPPVPGSNAKVSQIVPTLNAKSLIDGTFDDYHGSSLTFQICHSGLRDEMYGDVGMIKMYAGKTLPKGWVFCEGQELSIASYPDLFAAIGTKYGGDGTTNFVLPKLNSTSLSDLKTPKFAIATTTMGDDDDREGMYGLITLFGGDTPPPNWVFCEGQEFPIMDYMTLFSVIGTTYGGNGRQTLGLPKLSAASITEGAVAPKFIICKEGMFPCRP